MKADSDEPMHVSVHLRELRKRLALSLAALVVAAAASLILSDRILAALMAPLSRALPEGSAFVALAPMDAWLAKMKAALVAGLFLSSPVISYQIFAFASPALCARHRHRLVVAALLSTALFATGGLSCFYLVLPQAFAFFAASATAGGIAMMPAIGDYLGFVTTAVVAFGLVFEIPLAVGMLAAWGIVPLEKLSAARGYVIVVAFIAAAIATPPDALSQIALAIPLIALYELSILCVRIFRKGKNVQ